MRNPFDPRSHLFALCSFMTAAPLTSYRHTHRAPCWLVLCGMSLLFLALGIQLRSVPVASMILPLAGAFMLLLALSFRELTVKDDLDQLIIQFGPLPLFQRRIRYDEITGIGIDKTILLEGWGIHMSPRGGW